MNIIHRIFESLRPPRPKVRLEVRPSALEISPFRLLPLELVLMIASHLPPESAGILALSSTPLYSCLQMDYLKPLKPPRSLKEGRHPASYNFLDLLARDLPTYIACPHCSKLHSTLLYKYHAVAYPPIPAWPQLHGKSLLECRRADISSRLRLKVQPDFSSTLFRMAMKAHRQGHDTTEFLKLLSFSESDVNSFWYAGQRIASARIVDGSLLVREQRVFMIPVSQTIPFPWSASFYICFHLPYFTLKNLLRYGIQIPNSGNIETFENEQGILCCDCCYTEFRIDFKSYGEAGNAMFVTRWMDVGEGRDVHDPKWRNRLAQEEELSWRKVTYLRGSIAAAFEQGGLEFRFDSFLTALELKSLCRRGRWLWAVNDEVQPDDDAKPEYEVVDGRFVELEKEDGLCFCIR